MRVKTFFTALRLLLSYPIGLIRWTLRRNRSLQDYLNDFEYNMTAFGIVAAIVIMSLIFYQIYFTSMK